MHLPVIRLENPCAPDEFVCTLVYRLTEHQGAASTVGFVVHKLGAIVVLILIALVARWLLHRLIDRIVDRAAAGILPSRLSELTLGGTSLAAALEGESHSQRRAARAKTMGSVLKSLVTGVLFTITVIMAISELGYSIGPLLASAGIVGVALGFGAQSLVKDFLSGLFMIFEDQYGVGDTIIVNGVTGTVEAVSLRVTRLRDFNGTVWYQRNGEILAVGNQNQNWGRAIIDVSVRYTQDIAKVRELLLEVAESMWRDDEDFDGTIVEQPEVSGVEAVSGETVTIRVTMKTLPMHQAVVARAFRERVKARFDVEGIEVPTTPLWPAAPKPA